MRGTNWKIVAFLAMVSWLLVSLPEADGQVPGASTSIPVSLDAAAQLDQQLHTISSALALAQAQLEESQIRIQQLQKLLNEVQEKVDSTRTSSSASPHPLNEKSPTEIDLRERVETLEAEVKLHEQTKVESNSKYSVRISGLFLFNGFLNRGTVDNFDLGSIATGSITGEGDGGAGASLRQTILGVAATGPRLGGAKTSARLSVDFFGGTPYSSYGTVAGVLRLRTADIDLDWPRDSLQLGIEAPLISPLSPTSYATIGEPSLAWSGNLWTWAPQVRFVHQLLKPEERRLQFEFGLWDPPTSGYNSTTNSFRTPSAGELANQPAYESRISYSSSPGERALQIGVGGYYGRQRYETATNSGRVHYWSNDSWVATTDLRIPLSRSFELSGEAYRGRSLGGLGGGLYKDVLYGSDPITGYPLLRGLNDTGGWTQFKTRFGELLEANASIGLDNGFANDFHSVTQLANASPTQFLARNRTVVGNLVYHPKTYLIFSPEYRRIWTWPISGVRGTANIYTFTVGYQF